VRRADLTSSTRPRQRERRWRRAGGINSGTRGANRYLGKKGGGEGDVRGLDPCGGTAAGRSRGGGGRRRAEADIPRGGGDGRATGVGPIMKFRGPQSASGTPPR
jgi:hypothetical protein